MAFEKKKIRKAYLFNIIASFFMTVSVLAIGLISARYESVSTLKIIGLVLMAIFVISYMVLFYGILKYKTLIEDKGHALFVASLAIIVAPYAGIDIVEISPFLLNYYLAFFLGGIISSHRYEMLLLREKQQLPTNNIQATASTDNML